MDNRSATDVKDKVTTPVMSAIGQPDIGDEEDAFNHITAFLSQHPQRKGFFSRLGVAFRTYLTALMLTLPMLPIIGSVVTVGIFLSNPNAPGWSTVLYGMLYTDLAWWFITLFLIPITAARNSNARSFGLLSSRVQQLETRLHVINHLHHANQEQPLAEYQEVALQEAHDKFDDLNSDLNDSTIRFPWVMGFGYVNAWSKVHRAEEALVEVEPVEMVMRGAMHDSMAISGSQLSNRDELMAKLRYAVKKLDPSMTNLFKPLTAPATPGENENPDLLQLQQDVQKIARHLKVNLSVEVDDDDSSSGGKKQTSQSHDLNEQDRARLTLREVRRALNTYRDHLFEGLIRARNNLLGTMFVAGFVTHVLLCVVILSMTADGVAGVIDRATIAASTGYYIVGAIAGLFGRINQAAIANTAVDDYGFSFAQMISTPLLSGLAGVGGVLLSSALTSYNTVHGLSALQSIFTQTQPDTFIVAAFFGLTPNLLVRGLQNRAAGYISGLRSSKTTTNDTTASTNVEQNVGD